MGHICTFIVKNCNYTNKCSFWYRLDAGTFGTMGVGLGFAVAAAIYCRDFCPDKRVVCVEGDSAFGFSGMEIETLAR